MSEGKRKEKEVNRTEMPDPEVPERARRRIFTAEYKLRILEEVDRCTQHGEIGALLRREGLYSTILSDWRRQRREGMLDRLSPKKRGRKQIPGRTERERIAELERENERLRLKLSQAEKIIEVQKKLSEVLGISLDSETNEENEL